MPIIDRQRRLREAGRIRLGEKIPTSNGKSRPAKIDVFRFTSADEESIRAVAAVYGGEVRQWKDGPIEDQWELKSEAKVLDILVPPVQLAWSQWYEEWSGGGCQHRCDGQTDVLSKRPVPCVCDPENRTCKPTSRLSVIITAVDGIGTWRLETHGYNAADELEGSIEILRFIQDSGKMVSARLLLQERKKVKDGKTLRFMVPGLDLRVPMAALMGAQSAPELTAGATPIAATPQSVPSIRDQIAVAAAPVAKPRRANAAPAIPSTGVSIRGMSAPTPDLDDEIADGEVVAEQPVVPEAVVTSEPAVTPVKSAPATKPVNMRRLFALMNGNKNVVGSGDDDRHTWASIVLNRQIDSFTELSMQDVKLLESELTGANAPRVANTEPKQQSKYDQYSEEPF